MLFRSQDAILSEARYQADNMIQEATAQTNELVNEHEIMQRAYATANQIVEDAKVQAQSIIDAAVGDANNIRQGAIVYTDDILRNVQNIISGTMGDAQERLGAFLAAMQSSYDIVSSNRNELVADPAVSGQEGAYMPEA